MLSQAECIAQTFTDGPANPDQGKQMERFYRQAFWLGQCAELVYPPASTTPLDRIARQREWEILWRDFCAAQSDNGHSTTDSEADTSAWSDAVKAFAEGLHNTPGQESQEIPGRKARDTYAELAEADLDAIADELRGLHRKHFPWCVPWRWSSETPAMRAARQKWELAHQLWAEKAENRIRKAVENTWDPGHGKADVKFISMNGIEYFVAGTQTS